MTQRYSPLRLLPAFAVMVCALTFAQLARAADRNHVETFLNVTGFDVALDSIALSAESVPAMIGLEPEVFGTEFERISEDVFDHKDMRGQAVDYLEETLSAKALQHAQDFYDSALGQRLVKAENASHMIEDDEVKRIAGERIISDLLKQGDERIELLKRMGRAVNADDSAVHAVQEVQLRLLIAADTSGLIELQVDTEALKALLAEQSDEMRLSMQTSGLAASAYTYQGFDNAELENYITALETPEMQEVYSLLNAIQYEITASRYEEMAYRLGRIGAGQDI